MQTIFLEFKHETGNLAANGTDVIMYLDGRWGPDRISQEILDKVARLRSSATVGSQYSKQLFVGYTISGWDKLIEMHDPKPPAWASTITD